MHQDNLEEIYQTLKSFGATFSEISNFDMIIILDFNIKTYARKIKFIYEIQKPHDKQAQNQKQKEILPANLIYSCNSFDFGFIKKENERIFGINKKNIRKYMSIFKKCLEKRIYNIEEVHDYVYENLV